MPAAWFSDGEEAFESIKVPCIDVCTLIPASVISALAYCNLLFNRLPNFALHRLHIFFSPRICFSPRSFLLGPSLKSFHSWACAKALGHSLNSALLNTSLVGLLFLTPGDDVRMWLKSVPSNHEASARSQPWYTSLAGTALALWEPVMRWERRGPSKAINWQPTGHVWPTDKDCLTVLCFKLRLVANAEKMRNLT